MIYVVLGLAILVVSFVIALVSLAREQNLLTKKALGDTVSGNGDKTGLEKGFEGSSEVAPEVGDWQISATHKTREFNPDTAKREPFPWEIKDLKNEESKGGRGLTSSSDKSARLEGEFSISEIAGKLEG